MRRISQGAEAVIYDAAAGIMKDRIQKAYRLPEIDVRLRKFRTRREAKVLEKLAALGFPAPRIISMDDRKMQLMMGKIPGKKLRDVLERSDYRLLAAEIGRKVALLHNHHLIHGDLTTSNMILGTEVYLIDFGLSFFSHKLEDQAVDLHLLKQALESTHCRIAAECWSAAAEAYRKAAKEGEAVLRRLTLVEKRGRYKQGS